MLPGVRGLLDLIACEFQKLKRKRFVQLTIAAATLFPIPLTAVMLKDSLPFTNLFRGMFLFGDLLFLPCVLGILASMLFFMERDNDTLKNLLTIPISKTKILLAKLCILLVLSVVYSVAGLGATLVGGILVGGVEQVLQYLLCSILAGVLIFLATLPAILLVILCNKNYIFSVLLSFVYAIIGFLIVNSMASALEIPGFASVFPIPLAFRWYIGFFSLGEQFSYLLPYELSTLPVLAILIVIGIICSIIAVIFYKREEE